MSASEWCWRLVGVQHILPSIGCFDCCLPVAREQRTGLIARLDEVNFSLAVLDGGRQHVGDGECTSGATGPGRGRGGETAEGLPVAGGLHSETTSQQQDRT